MYDNIDETRLALSFVEAGLWVCNHSLHYSLYFCIYLKV